MSMQKALQLVEDCLRSRDQRITELEAELAECCRNTESAKYWRHKANLKDEALKQIQRYHVQIAHSLSLNDAEYHDGDIKRLIEQALKEQ